MSEATNVNAPQNAPESVEVNMHASENQRVPATTPILYYWAPCKTCSVVVNFAEEHGIALDKRDVEFEEPYQELLALGGDANLIPYLYDNGQLICGDNAVVEYLTEKHAIV